jgi:glutaredoxin-related protein
MKRILFSIVCISLASAAFAETDASEPNIVVYTTSFKNKIWPCGPAQPAVNILKDCGIDDFEVIDVGKKENIKARIRMERISGQPGVPVIDFGDTIMISWGRPCQRRIVENFVKNYFPAVGLFKLKIIFEKSQQCANNDEVRGILEKCFLAHQAKLKYECCFARRLKSVVEKSSFSGPEQEAVIAFAKNISSNDYRSAVGEFRRICSDNPAVVRQAKACWDEAASDDGFITFQWAELFANTKEDTSYLSLLQGRSAAKIVAIEDETKRVLDELFNVDSVKLPPRQTNTGFKQSKPLPALPR